MRIHSGIFRHRKFDEIYTKCRLEYFKTFALFEPWGHLADLGKFQRNCRNLLQFWTFSRQRKQCQNQLPSNDSLEYQKVIILQEKNSVNIDGKNDQKLDI